MKVLLRLGCLLWERVQREVTGNRTQQQTKRYILCWLYPIIKRKTPVFSQLTCMCFYIYTGSFLRLRAVPPHGPVPVAYPEAPSHAAAQEPGRPGRPPRTGWEGPRLSSGASGKHGTPTGTPCARPHPATGCRPCATPGPRGPPQRPAATAEAARGEPCGLPSSNSHRTKKPTFGDTVGML